MVRHTTTLLLLTILVTSIAGCGQHMVIDPVVTKVDLVWPARPEVPRIRYLHDISSAEDIDIRPGLFGRIKRFFKGEEERNIVRPYGIRKDAEGRLYVVDTFYRRVHVFDRKNAVHYMFPDSGLAVFRNPVDVAVGLNGHVYVSDSESNLIHVFTDGGKQYIKSIGEGELERPTGMAINSENNQLLVTDTLASSLVIFDEKELKIAAVVGTESDKTTGFHSPTNITFGKDGHIYVTDALNFRVQVLNREYEFIESFGSAGDSPGHFSRPKGIATDSEGNIYVVDALFGNVQIFDSKNRLLLAFGKPGHKPGEFWLPNAIFIDKDDRIYISDAYNQRLQVFQYLPYGDVPL